MKKITCRVIIVPECVMNVCYLRKGDLEDLGRVVTSALRQKKWNERERVRRWEAVEKKKMAEWGLTALQKYIIKQKYELHVTSNVY